MTEATQIVHWPGKDTPMCDKHANQARSIARAMGFNLSCTPLLFDCEFQLWGTVCKNCENEAKQHANRPTELP